VSEANSEQASKRASERGVKTPVRSFRDLLVWQRGMELAELVYGVTASFPADERWGLVLQLRRAAVSVPSNIAEGFGRQSRPDYLRFLRTARGSLGEVETQIELAARLRFLSDPAPVQALAREAAIMLQSLIRKLEEKEQQ
jgi:four helix bundle protein